MKPVAKSLVDGLIPLIRNLSIGSSEEDGKEYLIEDVWERVFLFLGTKGIRNFSLVSKNIRIIVLNSLSYAWYVHDKPKLCNFLSRLTVSLDHRKSHSQEVINKFITILLRSGYADIAKKTALICEFGSYRVKLLINSIAQAEIQQGNTKKAKKTLMEAKRASLNISNKHFQDLALVNIIEMQARSNDIDNAVETLKSISNEYYRARACLYIAQGKMKHGCNDSAIEIVQWIAAQMESWENEQNKDLLLQEINLFLLEMGDIPATNAIVQRMAEEQGRNEILLELRVVGLIQNNKKEEAKKSLIDKREEMLQEDIVNWMYDLRNIAAIQMEIGDNDGAKETLEKVKNGLIQESEINIATISYLIQIAERQIQYGDFEKAKNTLREIVKMTKDVPLELNLLNRVIQCLLELDDIAMVKDVLLRMPDQYEGNFVPYYNKANALNSIAEVQFRKGNKNEAVSVLKEAEGTAYLISDNHFKTKVLIKIAQTTFKYSNIKKTEDILEIAEKGIALISDMYHKARSIIDIAALRARINGIHAIESTLSKIIEEYTFINDLDRDKAFSALFRLYFQFGDIDNLMKIFDSIRYNHVKVDAVLRVMHSEEHMKNSGLITLSSFTKRVLK